MAKKNTWDEDRLLSPEESEEMTNSLIKWFQNVVYNNKLQEFEWFLHVKQKNWEVNSYYRKRINNNSDLKDIKSEVVRNLQIEFMGVKTLDKSLWHLFKKQIKLTHK